MNNKDTIIEYLERKLEDQGDLIRIMDEAASLNARSSQKQSDMTICELRAQLYSERTVLPHIYSLRDECINISSYVEHTTAAELATDLASLPFVNAFLSRPLPEQVFFFRLLVRARNQDKVSALVKSNLYTHWCCTVDKQTGLHALSGVQFHNWCLANGLGE